MRKLCPFVLSIVLCSFASASAQAPGTCSQGVSPVCTDDQSIKTSGSSITVGSNGGQNISIEEVVSGAPATVSIVTQACGKAGTCSVVDTNTTVGAVIRSISVTNLIDYLTVTATWTGGTNAAVRAVTKISTSSAGGSGGGGTVSVSNFPATQPVSGTFWQATQPVSGTFWQATQPVSGTVSVSNFPASQPVSGTFWQATQPVSGTFWQATQPVSGTLTDNQGSANTAANAWPVKVTDGTNIGAVKAASTAAAAADPSAVVAFSPNSPLPAGTNAVGALVPVTSATAALSSNTQAALTAAAVVKASAGNLYGVFALNGAASTCWIQFLNASSAPALGTAVVMSIPLPASTTQPVYLAPGGVALANFTTGISVGIATTATGATACGTAGAVVIEYK